MSPFKILFFGDVIGAIGRKGVVSILPQLREEFAPDFVIVNVENLAHGRGITAKTLLELDEAGVDAYTSGNHVWENPAGLSCFDDERWKDRLVRPANADPALAGRGSMIIEKSGTRIAIFNLLGQLFMKQESSSPFLAFDRLHRENPADIIIVDLHGEATSEKEAFGHYVDGRATAVFGTHTHVPTADQKILSGGTAYVTDAGRNGARDSIVGFEKTAALQTFLNPGRIERELPTSGEVDINPLLLTIDLETKRAVALDRIRRIVDV